jgi:hypothetical protein
LAIRDSEVSVRPVTPADEAARLKIRDELWPGSKEDHEREIPRLFDGRLRNPLAVVVAHDREGRILGFAELSIRPYAEGFASDAEADNDESIAAHLALGFTDRGLVRCFSKTL